MNVTQRRVLPFDREARLIFMKLPSRIRRSLNDLAAASGCPTLEIVRRFHEGAGHQSGGHLWELHRDIKRDHNTITAVAMAPEGKTLFVKAERKG
jgi:hypothetical protein